MFSYKILPLALLISLPVLAMEQQIEQQVVPADALNSTVLVAQGVTASEDLVAQLKEEQANLDARMNAALARKNAEIDRLQRKYTAKCEEICSLDTLKVEDEKKVKEATKAKTTALEALLNEYTKSKESLENQMKAEEVKYTKTKTTKEQEHDLIIAALATVVSQRQANIERISQTRDQLYTQLTKVKDASVEPKSGLLGWGFLGL